MRINSATDLDIYKKAYAILSTQILFFMYVLLATHSLTTT